MIDGRNDAKDIADRFASVFQDACVPNSLQHHNDMKMQFSAQYTQYAGENFDDKSITVDLTPKHIINAHPILVVRLSWLFRILLKYSIVPDSFGYGVVVPLVKNTDGNCFVSNNYRGITISQVISKIFESLLMSLFQDQLSSDPLQFGF